MFSKQETGFSLLEVLILLALLSFLLLGAQPLATQIPSKIKHHFLVRALYNDLADAKRLATLEYHPITICARHPTLPLRCAPKNSNNWHTGWLIFYDTEATFTPSKETMIRERSIPQAESHHTSSSIIANGNIHSAINLSPGRLYGRGIGTNLANGRFQLCRGGSTTHDIVLNIFGYTRLVTYTPKTAQKCHL